jgi:hypothetical protein
MRAVMTHQDGKIYYRFLYDDENGDNGSGFVEVYNRRGRTLTPYYERWALFVEGPNQPYHDLSLDYIRWVNRALLDTDNLVLPCGPGDCNPGDANGDGVVDLLDLDLLGQNYGVTEGAECINGDFNEDGKVDLLDLDILGQNYGNTYNGAVPEPVALSLLVLGAVALPWHRR